VRDAAAKIHDPKNGVYGICLRGKPGWGDNMAFLSTMANSFGAPVV
jgi:sorbitol/mannitol transport system substrate-binding protein